MLYGTLMFIFVIVAFMLIAIILLQSSQSGVGTAIGGQAMTSAFGGQGADKLLEKVTGYLAFIFILLSVIMGTLNNPDSKSSSISTESLSKGNAIQQENE